MSTKTLFRARFVYRSPHQNEIDKIRKRQATPTFKKRLIERKWKVEGLLDEAKENHCLRRMKYRGIDKAQIQFFMLALAQNIKRRVIGNKNNFIFVFMLHILTFRINTVIRGILTTTDEEHILAREKTSPL